MRIETLNLSNFGVKNKIFIFRDDLFPYYYGGNKARKFLEIVCEIKRNDANAVVTTGGIQSNHCRVVALACAELGLKCVLILHGLEENFNRQKGNANIIRESGSELVFTESKNISLKMERAIESLKIRGYRPYYLYGGGHNKAGVKAYEKVTNSLVSTLKKKNIQQIFLASGTGSTQTGIINGLLGNSMYKNPISVIGVSVGRVNFRGKEAVKEYLNQNVAVDFIDTYLDGGYGCYSKESKNLVDSIIKETGIIFDTTYSGKAMIGMMDILKAQKSKSNVLFWHTGGQFNFLM